MSIKIILLGLLCQTLSFTIQAKIQYDDSVKQEYKEVLQADLKFLKNFELHAEDEPLELLDLFAIKRFTGDGFFDWLHERVGYITSDIDFGKLDLKVLQTQYSYPHPDQFPSFEKPRLTLKKGPGTDNKTMAIMRNMGTFIYIKGKMDGKLYGLKILNKYITVSSPRTGILQIGPGLFHAKSQINSQSIGTSANRLNRLQSLIHEARHSDGHAYYLGFLHAVCPIGHTLENLTACDRNRNGPYTLGATFLREFVKDCSSCNENSKEQLRLRYLESFSRVIKTYKKSSLSRSEELELEFLQQRLQLNQLILTKAEVPDKQVILQRIAQFKKRIDELNAKNQNSPTIETVRWPDAPEGRRQ